MSDDGRILVGVFGAALLGATAWRGRRGAGALRRARLTTTSLRERVPLAPITGRPVPPSWTGECGVSQEWENEDGPEGWYAFIDDDGIHAYTKEEVMAVFLQNNYPTLNLYRQHRKDDLYLVGPLPVPGRDVPEDVSREPDGWWRVETIDGRGIAYAGTHDLAKYIAAIGPEGPE